MDGTHDDGPTRHRQHEVIEGHLIATGTIAAKGYGADPRERAELIATTLRDHLRRKQAAEIPGTVSERSAELNHRPS